MFKIIIIKYIIEKIEVINFARNYFYIKFVWNFY